MATEEKKEPTPVVPTLHAISTPCLSRPADIATYLIRWLFANPGRVSEVNEGEMISFRKLASEYASDPTGLAEAIASRLTESMNRYFPNRTYHAVCTVEDQEGIGEDGTYLGNKAITIKIADRNEIAIIPHANITVDKSGGAIDVTFEQNHLRS